MDENFNELDTIFIEEDVGDVEISTHNKLRFSYRSSVYLFTSDLSVKDVVGGTTSYNCDLRGTFLQWNGVFETV